jgi:hypothetical protein
MLLIKEEGVEREEERGREEEGKAIGQKREILKQIKIFISGEGREGEGVLLEIILIKTFFL